MSYVFQQYPMRITAPDGKRIRVMNQAEHDRLLEQWTEPDTGPVAPNALLADGIVTASGGAGATTSQVSVSGGGGAFVEADDSTDKADEV